MAKNGRTNGNPFAALKAGQRVALEALIRPDVDGVEGGTARGPMLDLSWRPEPLRLYSKVDRLVACDYCAVRDAAKVETALRLAPEPRMLLLAANAIELPQLYEASHRTAAITLDWADRYLRPRFATGDFIAPDVVILRNALAAYLNRLEATHPKLKQPAKGAA
jgi:hypothetical protein